MLLRDTGHLFWEMDGGASQAIIRSFLKNQKLPCPTDLLQEYTIPIDVLRRVTLLPSVCDTTNFELHSETMDASTFRAKL